MKILILQYKYILLHCLLVVLAKHAAACRYACARSQILSKESRSRTSPPT